MTTTVYRPLCAEGFELCHPRDDIDFETINVQINGIERAKGWAPIPMHLVREDEGQMLVESDSPWLGSHALIFRRRKIERLEALLTEYGELLPLACAEADLVVFNPTKIIDALDDAASTITRFSGGRIMSVARYEFRPDLVAGVELFKIPSLRVSPTFVSANFVRLWQSSGLAGLDFTKVWTC